MEMGSTMRMYITASSVQYQISCRRLGISSIFHTINLVIIAHDIRNMASARHYMTLHVREGGMGGTCEITSTQEY